MHTYTTWAICGRLDGITCSCHSALKD